MRRMTDSGVLPFLEPAPRCRGAEAHTSRIGSMAHHDHVELCHCDSGLPPGDVRELLTYVESSYVGGRVDIQRAHTAVGPAKADHHTAGAALAGSSDTHVMHTGKGGARSGCTRFTVSSGGAAPRPAVSPGVAAPSPGEDGVINKHRTRLSCRYDRCMIDSTVGMRLIGPALSVCCW